MKIALACLAILSASVSAVCAEDHFLRGAEELRRGDWAAAEGTLAQLVRERPKHAEGWTLLGMARYHLDSHGQAVAALDRALQLGTRYQPRTLFYKGLALSKLGRKNEARGAFDSILRDHPNSSEAGRLRASQTHSGYGTAPDKPVASEPPRFVLLLGLHHDSNATRLPDSPLIIGGQGADQFAMVMLSASSDEKSPVRARGSLFLKNYFEYDALDVGGLAASIERELDAGEKKLVPRYDVQQLWLAGNPFELRHKATLAWRSSGEGGAITETALEISSKSYDDAAYSNLDGTTLTLRLKSELRPDGGRFSRVAGDFMLSRDTARADHLGYDTADCGVRARMSAGKRGGLELRAGLRGRFFHEVDPDPLVFVKRQDLRIMFSATAFIPMSDKSFLRLGASHAENLSNIEKYGYGQTVVGADVMFVF